LYLTIHLNSLHLITTEIFSVSAHLLMSGDLRVFCTAVFISH